MKFTQGAITNTKTNITKDIVVEAKHSTSLKDTLIGCLFMSIGISYLTNKAFKNGSKAFEEAEYKTLSELDLFN